MCGSSIELAKRNRGEIWEIEEATIALWRSLCLDMVWQIQSCWRVPICAHSFWPHSLSLLTADSSDKQKGNPRPTTKDWCELRDDSQEERTAFHRLQHQPCRVAFQQLDVPALPRALACPPAPVSEQRILFCICQLPFLNFTAQPFSPLCPIPIGNSYSIYSVTLLLWTDFTETLLCSNPWQQNGCPISQSFP